MNTTTSTSGFTFGQPATTNTIGSFSLGQPAGTAQSGFSFGNPQTTTTAAVNPLTSSSFSFGSLNAAQPASPSTGFSLGQTNPISSSGFSLGQTNPTTISGLNFGQVTSSGFGSGQQNPSSTPGFSLGSSSLSSGGFSFAPTTSVNPTSTTTGINFGQPTTSAPSTGLSLGQVNSSTSTGLFGQTPATGFTFGQTPTSTPSTSSSGLFSQPQATNPSLTSASSVLFGETQTSNAAVSSTGLFGQNTPGSTPGIFSQPSSSQPALSSTGPSFGLSTNASTSGGLFSQTSNAPSSSALNFGVSAPSTTKFGFTSCITSTPGSSTSIFPSVAASVPSFGLGGSLPSSTGVLEGLQSTSTQAGIGSSKDGKSSKEITLPEDTIAIFEAYKDKEKMCSEDNVRQTAAPFHKLVEDSKKLRQHIVQLSNQYNQLHTTARKLKSAVIQEAENVEMARRTQDTPMNFQGDNKAPEQFFLRLVRSFEERMTFCRNRIEEVEKCSRTNGSGSEITSEDMKEVLKKEHEMVKLLAAKIYTMHNQLINYTSQSSIPDLPHPEALFRRHLPGEEQLHGISHKNSSILRPALGEHGSGLLNFQNGQQRAKAFSLGAAPPTIPLNQTSIPSMGSSTQGSLFSGSNPTFSSLLNFNTSTNPTSFGYGSKTGFSPGSTNTSSLFGTPQMQQSGLFGAVNNSAGLASGAKSLKK